MSDISATRIDLNERLTAARALLHVPAGPPVSARRALGAAALAAVSGLTLAAAVILGPGVEDGPQSRAAASQAAVEAAP
jgi:hypothetical protein